MNLNRRHLLAAAALGAAVPLGYSLSGQDAPSDVEDGQTWQAGPVQHLLPAASSTRFLIKLSLNEPATEAPVLRAGDLSVAGLQMDTAGTFYTFDVGGLTPDTEYDLQLQTADGRPLTDPWPLRTFPSRSTSSSSFRLLCFSCAGGPNIFFDQRLDPVFLHSKTRKRLLARALAFQPDAAIANGDHVYWDIKSRMGWAMGRSPMAWLEAGFFDRSAPILGTANEAVLKAALQEQIPDLYGTLFRSTPIFFLQDDHDYFENDEASASFQTFPADPFMIDAARTTQDLYYPAFPDTETLPAVLVDPDTQLARHYGAIRYGDLCEVLAYDCRRHFDAGSEGYFVPAEAEDWIIDRTRHSSAAHVINMPSTPVLWTAGKWGEWYPDIQNDQGELTIDAAKPMWPRAWFEQHNRLLAAAHSREDRLPLFVSGDLHATGMGAIKQSGDLDLRSNPVISILVGTPGTGNAGWPSNFRGQRARPSLMVEAEEWVPALEENGFSLFDFTPESVTVSQFRWTPDQGEDAIDELVPFVVRTFERPSTS